MTRVYGCRQPYGPCGDLARGGEEGAISLEGRKVRDWGGAEVRTNPGVNE